MLAASAGCAPLPRQDLPADVGSRPIFSGVTFRRVERTGPVAQVIHIVEIDLRKPGIDFMTTPSDTSAGREYRGHTTSEFVRANGLALAVNGSYFLPFEGGSKGGENYYPRPGDPVDASGMAMHQGKFVSPVETGIDVRVNAALCFRGRDVRIVRGQICPKQTREAIAAGPLLLAAGQQQSYDAFDRAYGAARHPRTAIGLDAARRRMWIVVVDGRQPGYSEGASLDELMVLFAELGASDAINLDGGGSSTLAVAGSDGTRPWNQPIHTAIPGRERPVANQIGLFARSLSQRQLRRNSEPWSLRGASTAE